MSTEIRSTKSCFINSISSCLCQIALICLLNKFEHIYAKECQIQKSQVLNPLKSSSAKTEIDLFQNAPEFEVEFYNISIVENLPNGFSVLQVTAHDNERAQNAELTYELEDNSGAFSIDPNSGWLIVKNELILDREKRSVIKMKVFAMKKMPSITNTKNVVNFSNIVCSPTPPVSFVNVEVMILDVNDNTPIFFPSNHYELIVESDSKIGKVIGKVYADDRDQGNNGIVSYRLQKTGNVTYGYPFAVDTYTGEISVTQSPMSVGKHVIFIEAVDNPLNPSEKRFSLAVVTIQVIQSSGMDGTSIVMVELSIQLWNLPIWLPHPYKYGCGALVVHTTDIFVIFTNLFTVIFLSRHYYK